MGDGHLSQRLEKGVGDQRDLIDLAAHEELEQRARGTLQRR